MKASNWLLVATIIVMLLWTAQTEEILAKTEVAVLMCKNNQS